MRPARLSALLAVFLAVGCPSFPQAPAQTTAPIERRTPSDPDLDLASNLIGQALFLRCFCEEDTLTFTSSGTPELKAKARPVDWTLSGVNVLKAERRSPTAIELDGLRVAVRYAPDRREWDRHPQKSEPVRITVADTSDPTVFHHALTTIFTVGIDRAFQRSTPPYWQHFFDPQTPWPPDELTGATLYPATKPGTPGQVTAPPVATHKAEPGYTLAAQRDRVQGTAQLQFVVDTQGVVRHIAIAQPLGYGLDAEAAEAAAKMRFTPAQLGDRPVPSPVLLRQDFSLIPPPQ